MMHSRKNIKFLKPVFCVTVHRHLIYLFSVTSSLCGVLFKFTFICPVLEKCILSAGICPAGSNPLCRGLPANLGHWHGYHAGKNHYHKEGINHISTGTKQCSTCICVLQPDSSLWLILCTWSSSCWACFRFNLLKPRG